MKRYLLIAAVAALAAVAAVTLYAQAPQTPQASQASQSRPAAPALNGEPYIHDPSTVTFSDGKYYTFGTGGGGLMSDDGWTWRGGAVRPGGGVAPDVIHIGNRYYVSYARGGGGMSGGHASNVYVMWTKTLDPNSPDFGYHDEAIVASSDGVEDCDAIDPAFLLDPTTGRLWLSYGTFFGYIRLVELDPKTGKRVVGNKAINIAIDMEATALMYRDGWYYLLGTHGTCCDGANSTYNIRVARSRKVTGPYVDNVGIDALKGGGKLVVAASGRFVGPGHFGLLDLGDGVQKFSCHYEADLDRSGRSVLDIRPLLWKDGWPYAGDNLAQGTYEIQSERSGYALELAVDFVRMASMRRMGGGPVGGGLPVPGPARQAAPSSGPRRWSAQARLVTRRSVVPVAAAVRRPDRTGDAGSGAGPGRGVEGLAGRHARRSPGRLHVPSAPEVDDRASAQRRRLSWRHPISRSPSPAPSARWRPPPTRRWWRFRNSPAVPNNSGASTS